jgi:hypothetical protein
MVLGIILVSGIAFIYVGMNTEEQSKKTNVKVSATTISAAKQLDLKKDYPSNNDQHNKLGFDCATCHGDFKDPEELLPVNNEQCFTCHGDYKKLAERTSFLDEKEVNPHDGFHHKDQLDCADCHSEHEQSVNYCANCHDTKVWMKQTP